MSSTSEPLAEIDWQSLPAPERTGTGAGTGNDTAQTGDCVFTVDVEDWYHANFRSAALPDGQGMPRRVEAGVDALLTLLSDTGTTATFFVLGCVAADHPHLARRIADAGHEIACHGMQHTLAYEQSPDDLRRSIGDARNRLCDQTGQSVMGFRAPSWSITDKNFWAFDVLVECGFRYDSSVFPAANYLYGVRGAPRDPYRIRVPAGELLEIPPPVVRVGPLHVGAGGGFYLRALPMAFHRRAMRVFARRGAPFLSYVHPREFDPEAWPLQLPLSWLEERIHSYGIGRVRRRVESLLRAESWGSIAEMLIARSWLVPDA